MKKTLIALMIAATLPSLAAAAPGDHRYYDHEGPGYHGHEGPGRDKGCPMMMEGPRGGFDMKALKLTPEQHEKISALHERHMEQHRSLMKEHMDKIPEAERKAFKEKMDANRDEEQKDIRALLNPEQQKAFDDMQKKRQDREAEWKEFQDWKARKAKADN